MFRKWAERKKKEIGDFFNLGTKETSAPQPAEGGDEDSDRQLTIDDLRSAAPLVVERPAGDGGLQSLKGRTECLRQDEDGDEAHDFIVIDEHPKRQKT